MPPERTTSELLSIASHELKGPMTVIKGYLTMLASGSLGEMGPRARSVLPLLISKSDEVNWLIEQMVEVARLDEGRLELNRKRCDMLDLAETAIAGMRLLMAGHEVRMDEPSDPVLADVDSDRIQIVIRNLLSNAAKYASSGGEIRVSVRREPDSALVSVADEGPGIALEDQHLVFARVVRPPVVGNFHGMGLGLWLSREIARKHGGDLTLESSPGSGSTFVLRVPLKA